MGNTNNSDLNISSIDKNEVENLVKELEKSKKLEKFYIENIDIWLSY